MKLVVAASTNFILSEARGITKGGVIHYVSEALTNREIIWALGNMPGRRGEKDKAWVTFWLLTYDRET
jgi:lipopolysaccharide biosynthesis regulator YciM